MKKVVGLLIVIFFAIGIVGCSNPPNTENPVDVPNQEDPLDVDELDESDEIEMSVTMTKEDIINMLGNNYQTTNSIDEMNDSNLTTIIYPGISFQFSHDGVDVPAGSYPSAIEIISPLYRYNMASYVGANALDAINACENVFENVINIHAEVENQELPDWFIYGESASGSIAVPVYVLAFQYDTGQRYFNKQDIPTNAIITVIQFLGNID